MFTPIMAASRHMGTISTTASGRVKASYCAASTRKTKTTAMMKIIEAPPEACFSCRASSVHS